jgi:predicted DNA-binding protein
MGLSKKAARRLPTAGRKGQEPHITARLPEEMIRELDRLAHLGGITRSEAIRRLIEQALRAEPRI